jgi:hypothetical protein
MICLSFESEEEDLERFAAKMKADCPASFRG